MEWAGQVARAPLGGKRPAYRVPLKDEKGLFVEVAPGFRVISPWGLTGLLDAYEPGTPLAGQLVTRMVSRPHLVQLILKVGQGLLGPGSGLLVRPVAV